jgi:predicted  nucleic acid-binding Zn ribbon protein
MKAILLTIATVALTSTGAFAYGEATIEANEAIQQQRIEQNRYNGQLTRKEYRQLISEQARIRALEKQAEADGKVTKREYRQIHDAQIDAYRHIKSESTDGQVSLWRRWLWLHR